MTRFAAHLGPGAYLAFLSWALLLVALLPDSQLWALLLLVVAFGGLSGGEGLRVLTRGRFWLFVLSILALSPFILGEADVRWGGLPLSRAGLEAGAGMALRAATLALAFSVGVGGLSVARLMHLFDGLGVRGLGFALGVALNLVPVLQDVVGAAYHTLRLRGGFRRPVQNTRLFLITVIANALRYGDDVVKAASARAFDPTARLPQSRPILGSADVALIAGLAAVGAGLLVVG